MTNSWSLLYDELIMTSNNPNRFKYSEDEILKELSNYISETYNAHYSAGDDKVQTLDLIEAVVMVRHSVDPTF